MEIDDRLENTKALSSILVTVVVRQTLVILWSSENESSHRLYSTNANAAAANWMGKLCLL
jgi:hypothetical protein